MQKQHLKGYVTKTAEGKYKVLASTSVIDRMGDSIDQSGWDLSNYKMNPVMPWAHNYSILPVAKATSIEVTDKGLEAEFEFASAEGNPMAQQVKTLYDEGFLNAVSVGFIPLQRNGNVITKSELLEISFVPVPANQEALRLAIKSIDDDENLNDENRTLLKELIEKGEVADELSAEETWEQKYENWCSVIDIISAFWTVYFDEATPVTDFGTLITEVAGLLQALSTSDDTATDDTKAMLKASISDVTTAAFIAFTVKSGKVLSKKTLDDIDKAISSMKDATTVLETLKSDSSSAEKDGEGDDQKAKKEVVTQEVDEDEVMSLSHEDMKIVRRTLINKGKDNELALSIVNAHLKEKGIAI